MPIRPENKNLYPDNWYEIRQQVLIRADNRCEICGVGNHTYRNGVFIVLTIAHWDDHNPANCSLDNLKAACQRCHNQHDAPVRAAGRKKRRREEIEKTQTTIDFNQENK